jgi:hypothetical protein
MIQIRQFQDDIEGLSLYIELDDGDVISVVVTSRRGEMAQFEDQLYAIASTIEYTPKPCGESDVEE